MNIAYLTYFHRRNIPQVQCLIASIRLFDRQSDIIAVVDDECWDDLPETFDKSVAQIPMRDAEEECRNLGVDWGSVRGSRSERDVAWTFQSCYPFWWLTETVRDSLPDQGVVYVDSDCFFYQDLRPYIGRLPETAHVALCPHRYPPGKENKSAGVFNNGMMYWRNSDKAREIAKAWGLEAIAKWEPHEQILLDAWPQRYGDAVAEFPPNCDRGPWSLLESETINGSPYIRHDGSIIPLQSFHYHEMRRGIDRPNPVMINGQTWNLCGYPIHPTTLQAVYHPYIQTLERYT